MFFKVVIYTVLVLALLVSMGQLNYATSLYKTADNAFEFIFPRWDWGHPWFYIFADEHGFSMTAPDDLEFRYFTEKYNEALKVMEEECKAGPDSESCITAESAAEDLKDKLQDASEKLEDIMEEKGDEVKLSRKYERPKFEF